MEVGSSGKQNPVKNDKPLPSGSVGWSVVPYTQSDGLGSRSEHTPGFQFPSPGRCVQGAGGGGGN